MPAASYPKIDGSVQTLFHFGGPAGPSIRSTGGVLEARDPTNAGFAIMRGLTPVAANDLVTKGYADALAPMTSSLNTGTFTENAGTFTTIVTVTATRAFSLIMATASGLAANGATTAQALFQLLINGAVSSATGFGFSSQIIPPSSSVNSIESGSLSFAFNGAQPAGTVITLQGKIVTPGTLTISIGSLGHGASLSLI